MTLEETKSLLEERVKTLTQAVEQSLANYNVATGHLRESKMILEQLELNSRIEPKAMAE